MKIGILQTGLVPPNIAASHGEYSNMFARELEPLGFEIETWSIVDGVFPDGPESADGWLITGSKHGAYDDLPWIAPLEDLIRDIYAANRPLIGVCFGHQIIAQALGGRVEKFAGGWAVGVQSYDFGAKNMHLQAWHQDQVVIPPDGAKTVASNAFCAHAALLYDTRVFTVQPHPEFDDGVIDALIATRGPGVVPDALLDGARARQGTNLNRAEIFAQFAQFYTERRIA